MSATESVIIAQRFRGPPQSANGGYACGVVARHLHGAVQVRLSRPPPLDQPLELESHEGNARLLQNGEAIAAALATTPAADALPDPVDFADAERASRAFRWFEDHPFPGCFVCGPARVAGDGLRIFPGRVPGRELVAAPWVVDASLCDSTGQAALEVVWAALDCPSWFGVLEFEPAAAFGLLGQLTAAVRRRPANGERCVVLGWNAGRDGRKQRAGAALYTDTGELLGSSSAIWIAPKG